MRQNLLLTFALLLTMHCYSLVDKETVVVKNDISGENITIHCYSSDDDLGVHTLAYAANFTWYFHVNIGGSTKFYCDLTTGHGSGNYGVFDKRLENQCDDYCLWLIKATGPCLVQKVIRGELYCQPWKKPPYHIKGFAS
ncbi:pumilio homolog 15-like [Sesamum indicum]|uniref:S-protein homolog n=1 Tax=Sesamum indicum TaxID=4182 RepID=A0A6I9SUP4_SESIN|nr:pumilio homolog 15-like [Sesamum indicum]